MRKDWNVKEEQMDRKELEILYTMLDKSVIVSGCAGSGKSMLAVKLAKRIEQEKDGSRQIVVYTKALEHFIEEGTKTLNLNCRLTHYEHWKWRLVEKLSDEGNRYFEKEVYCPHADYFIVDEIQDFPKAQVQEFMHAADKHFFFFGDTAQTIYKNTNPLTVSEIKNNIIPSNRPYKEYTLYYNYRLPLHIAEAAQFVGENLEPFEPGKYKSQETTLPRIVQFEDRNSQIVEISNFCKANPTSDIAILVPYKLDVINIYNQMKSLGVSCEIKYDQPDNSNGKFPNSVDTLDMSTFNPKIMTYHSAKGLQFENVFIPWVSESDKKSFLSTHRTALYVAMTRTYRNLFIMHTGSFLPHPLAFIPKEKYLTTMTDNVEDM